MYACMYVQMHSCMCVCQGSEPTLTVYIYMCVKGSCCDYVYMNQWSGPTQGTLMSCDTIMNVSTYVFTCMFWGSGCTQSAVMSCDMTMYEYACQGSGHTWGSFVNCTMTMYVYMRMSGVRTHQGEPDDRRDAVQARRGLHMSSHNRHGLCVCLHHPPRPRFVSGIEGFCMMCTCLPAFPTQLFLSSSLLLHVCM